MDDLISWVSSGSLANVAALRLISRLLSREFRCFLVHSVLDVEYYLYGPIHKLYEIPKDR